MTPCDLVAPWCLQGLCCAWWLWCVGLVAGCGGRGCCLTCLQAVGRLGRCRCYPGPAVLGDPGRAGDNLSSTAWILVLVWFLRIRGERLHTLLAFGQGLLVVRRAPTPAQDAVEGWQTGGGSSELSGVVVGDEVDVLEEQLVEHASDVVGCVVVSTGHVLGDVQCLDD